MFLTFVPQVSTNGPAYLDAITWVQKATHSAKDGMKLGFGDASLKQKNIIILAAVLMPPKNETPANDDWEKLLQAKLLVTVKF